MSFRLLLLEPGFKSRDSFSTNEKQKKKIRSHLERAIFPALCASYRYAIVKNSDWLIVLFAPVVIGRSTYFGMGFSSVIMQHLFLTS